MKEGGNPHLLVWRGSWGSSAPHSGTYAYALSNHFYAFPTPEYLPVSPNTQYRLSAFVRGKIDVEDSSNAWSLRAYFYDNNGSLISNAAAISSDVVNASWTEYAGTVTAPANAVKMFVRLFAVMQTGYLEADNFSVTMVNPTYTTISRKYYYAGGERVAMNASDTGLAWILSDHLGSTTKVIRALDYATLSETRYKPFGQARYVDGVSPTKREFTGQIIGRCCKPKSMPACASGISR